MAFARHALFAVIIHRRTFKADQWDKPAQKQIDFMKLFKRLQSPAAHEAIIRVIVNHFGAEQIQNFVIPFCLSNGIKIYL